MIFLSRRFKIRLKIQIPLATLIVNHQSRYQLKNLKHPGRTVLHQYLRKQEAWLLLPSNLLLRKNLLHQGGRLDIFQRDPDLYHSLRCFFDAYFNNYVFINMKYFFFQHGKNILYILLQVRPLIDLENPKTLIAGVFAIIAVSSIAFGLSTSFNSDLSSQKAETKYFQIIEPQFIEPIIYRTNIQTTWK